MFCDGYKIVGWDPFVAVAYNKGLVTESALNGDSLSEKEPWGRFQCQRESVVP